MVDGFGFFLVVVVAVVMVMAMVTAVYVSLFGCCVMLIRKYYTHTQSGYVRRNQNRRTTNK